jgi:hypothetical protein
VSKANAIRPDTAPAFVPVLAPDMTLTLSR